MRTIETIFIGALALMALSSCQDDNNDGTIPFIEEGMTQVKFELDASSLNHNSLTRTYYPTYNKNGFSIYAYKQIPAGEQNAGDYAFVKTINLDGMTYPDSNNKLSGTENLPIGTYKFIAAYGLNNQSGKITTPDWQRSALIDNLSLGYNGTSPLSEIFLETGNNVQGLEEYDLGLTEATNPTVQITLKRAVSRVDILFVSATKVGDTYVEKAYYDPSSNVFDNKELETLQLKFTDANNVMTIFGKNATQDRTPQTFNVDRLNYADNSRDDNGSSKVVVGNAGSTSVGTSTYARYDNVQAEDIISGGAHVFGSYLFPNDTKVAPENPDKTTGLEIFIKPVGGTGRSINISTTDDTKLPLEANKVTIVKVYVLNDNNVFSTTVDFEVEIETVWADSHEVIGEIS